MFKFLESLRTFEPSVGVDDTAGGVDRKHRQGHGQPDRRHPRGPFLRDRPAGREVRREAFQFVEELPHREHQAKEANTDPDRPHEAEPVGQIGDQGGDRFGDVMTRYQEG